MITVQDVEKALPANLKSAASQQLADTLNNAFADPDICKEITDNFVSYTNVLQEGKYRVEDYISAVKYVTFKLMGKTNQDAWALTFPQRYQNLVAKGCDKREMSSHVSMYNKGKLVNAILEQTLVPIWVLNQHIYQEAINTQADLMRTANSEKVRSDAANSIMTHLGKPKDVAASVAIQVNVQNNGMDELKDLLMKTAEEQRSAIESGVGIKHITAQKIQVIDNAD